MASAERDHGPQAMVYPTCGVSGEAASGVSPVGTRIYLKTVQRLLQAHRYNSTSQRPWIAGRSRPLRSQAARTVARNTSPPRLKWRARAHHFCSRSRTLEDAGAYTMPLHYKHAFAIKTATLQNVHL